MGTRLHACGTRHLLLIIAGSKAGLIRTSVFTEGDINAPYVSADGTWLSIPDAALISSANTSDGGCNSAVLLTLNNPVYDAATQVRAACTSLEDLLDV